MVNTWFLYLEYLKEWADTHRDLSNCGSSPAAYREWLDNEYIELCHKDDRFVLYV